jgi:hypothetical protein
MPVRPSPVFCFAPLILQVKRIRQRESLAEKNYVHNRNTVASDPRPDFPRRAGRWT